MEGISMTKYIYPAIFTKEEQGYSVVFPDLESCYTQGDTLEYRKRYNNRSVKKTLTIPEWLNEEASALGVNFSQVLQEALMSILSKQTK